MEGIKHRPELEKSEESEKPEGYKVNAQGDIIRLYLNDIAKTELLSADQEVELAMAIEAGLFAAEKLDTEENLPEELREDLAQLVHIGAEAYDHLIRANLRLVVSIARRYVGQGLLFMDLIQEGNLGLARAVQKFDYEKGNKFSTYATWWIRQAISRAIANQGATIRKPVHMIEQLNKLNRAVRSLTSDLGRDPSSEEISAALGIAVEELFQLQIYAQDTVSLDAPLGDSPTDGTLGDMVATTLSDQADVSVEKIGLREGIEAALSVLSSKERAAIELRFGLLDGTSRTLEEVGGILGVTREGARQLEAKGLGKLRAVKVAKPLRNYLYDG